MSGVSCTFYDEHLQSLFLDHPSKVIEPCTTTVML